MTRDEALDLVAKGFSETGDREMWWNEANRETYLANLRSLIDIYNVPVDVAYNVLASGFAAAADEYGD